MSGDYFTDNNAGIDEKVIRKVIVRSGAIVDGLCFEYTNGERTPWYGGQGGVQQGFELQDKEDITQVLICSNNSVVQKLSFITSNGRQSIWFGIDGQRPAVWEFGGKALAGFSGTTGQYLNGVQALWSDRNSRVGPEVLKQLIAEAGLMSEYITSAGRQNESLIRQVAELSNELTVKLHAPAEDALAGILTLARLVYELSGAAGAENKALVAKCKGQSVVVGKRFENLHTLAHNILSKSTAVATDITYQEASTQSRMKRVGEMLDISRAMQLIEENVRQMRLDRIEDARDHIRMAENTRREAEHKRDEAQAARIVRDIFTLGLGELNDWGGLNEAINYADQLINSANANLSSCETGLAQAQANVNAVNEELSSFNALRDVLGGFGPTLRAQADSMNALTQRILDLENHALDAGVFLSRLAGKASVLGVQHSAKQLAASVLAIEGLMGTGSTVTGVLVDNPDSLDAALQTIAQSAVEPSPADEMV
ncbi:hypothetical protein GGX14DRAFT_369556 [Mycena pura]|uniref:Jacalin-type lectin domain-containing protein n=1 Tax=Mycena pura TaxID=153505 RepID=A0AAD6Y988_9AGAR|nr:hypothetical protein GGX14DRAFT_369556 [Mycena pura]